MVIGTCAVFWFSGGGIISGDPCSEFDGTQEEEWYKDINGNGDYYCGEESQALWEADAENRFAKAQTSAFAVFILFQLFNVLNCRSISRSVFKLGIFNNNAITISFAISSIFLYMIVQGAHVDIPILGIQLGELLSVVPLEPLDWAIVFATASSILLADELRKLIFNIKRISDTS